MNGHVKEDSKDVKITKFINENLQRVEVPIEQSITSKEELKRYVITRTDIKNTYFNI